MSEKAKKSESSRKNAEKAREARKQQLEAKKAAKEQVVEESASEEEEMTEDEDYAVIDNAMAELKNVLLDDIRNEMMTTYKSALKPKIRKLIAKEKVARKAQKQTKRSAPVAQPEATTPLPQTSAQRFSSMIAGFK